jgi:ABC-type multidrug transport system fused ATPase/permease subunit
VTIDGHPISRYDVHHLRRHIGVVSQDNVLFSTSIKENIIYVRHMPCWSCLWVCAATLV